MMDAFIPNVDARRLRISRVPSKPVRREADGGFTVDLWLQREGTFVADLPLLLTPSEAEMLHAQLCYVLGDEPVTPLPDGVPDCRKGVQASSGPHRR
jgi:hypothetical protein